LIKTDISANATISPLDELNNSSIILNQSYSKNVFWEDNDSLTVQQNKERTNMQHTIFPKKSGSPITSISPKSTNNKFKIIKKDKINNRF
jgi:hypothetical protein